MKRNAIAVVVVALALGLKLLLPAGALAHASHALNQETGLQDCSSALADSAGDHAHSPGKGERHGAGCPLCQLFCEGSVALPERAPLRSPVVLIDRAGPVEPAAHAALATSLASVHQARAPPLF